MNDLYVLVTKMAIVAYRGGYKMIIENPYSSTHHLTKYWALEPSIIDENRREKGDFQKKPTQYWFIGLKPKNNLILEAQFINKKWTHNGRKADGIIPRQVMRSMIAPEYANRFIREFIL